MHRQMCWAYTPLFCISLRMALQSRNIRNCEWYFVKCLFWWMYWPKFSGYVAGMLKLHRDIRLLLLLWLLLFLFFCRLSFCILFMFCKLSDFKYEVLEVSASPFTTEAWVKSLPILVGFVASEVALVHLFFWTIFFCHNHSTIAPVPDTQSVIYHRRDIILAIDSLFKTFLFL